MSDRGQKRHRLKCIHAYKLAQSGMTNRQIADLVGRQVSSIPSMVKIGARFADGPIVSDQPSQGDA